VYGYIYKTTFLETGLYYVGQHKATKFEPQKYLGSGTVFLRILHKQQRLSRKRGEKWKDVWHKYFKCEVLEECDSLEILNDREIFWIDSLDARNPAVGYNITAGGLGGSYSPTEETREKLRIASSNKIAVYNEYERLMIKPEQLQDCLANGYIKGVPPFERSDDFKEKVSQTLTGYKCIHKGQEKHRVPAKELDYYLSIGYELGWPKTEKPRKPTGPRKGMLSPTGQYKVIAESEQEKYLQQGWIFGAPSVPLEKRNFGIRPNEETRKRLSESHKGKKPAKEAVEKQAEKLRGRIVINKDGKKKLIDETDLEKFLAEGWRTGGLAGEKHPKSKAVVCYETGEEFASMNLVLTVYPKAGALKRCLQSAPSSCCSGLHWYYKNDLTRKMELDKLYAKHPELPEEAIYKTITEGIDLEF
jgi:hypothetical protein